MLIPLPGRITWSDAETVCSWQILALKTAPNASAICTRHLKNRTVSRLGFGTHVSSQAQITAGADKQIALTRCLAIKASQKQQPRFLLALPVLVPLRVLTQQHEGIVIV